MDLREHWVSYRQQAFLIAFLGLMMFPSQPGFISFSIPHGVVFLVALLSFPLYLMRSLGLYLHVERRVGVDFAVVCIYYNFDSVAPWGFSFGGSGWVGTGLRQLYPFFLFLVTPCQSTRIMAIRKSCRPCAWKLRETTKKKKWSKSLKITLIKLNITNSWNLNPKPKSIQNFLKNLPLGRGPSEIKNVRELWGNSWDWGWDQVRLNYISNVTFSKDLWYVYRVYSMCQNLSQRCIRNDTLGRM